jgi:hypothetical protein
LSLAPLAYYTFVLKLTINIYFLQKKCKLHNTEKNLELIKKTATYRCGIFEIFAAPYIEPRK